MRDPDPAPTGFDGLPADPRLLEAVAALGFTATTPIQAAALPILLAVPRRDLVGRARTGSGKTLAFALPLLHHLRRERRLQALILVPTRELADQVSAQVRALGKRLPGLRVVTVVGGLPIANQVRALGEGAHVVVATPGRACDHLRRETLDLSGVATLVVDEADRMLELGFAADLDAIRARLPADRATALFSATFPPAVDALAAGWTRDPVSVAVDDDGVSDTVCHAIVVPEADRVDALSRLLIALQPGSALVFRNLKRTVGEAAEALREAGFAADALHGDLSPVERDSALAAFRTGATRVLVATDLAARGLDIDGVDLVVSVDPAHQPVEHVHRIGRTGRAGAPGVAWTFVDDPGSVVPPATLHDRLPDPPPGAGPLAAHTAALWIGAGRRDKLRPGDVLGALTGDAGLAGANVGRIEIHDRHTFVGIAIAAADDAVRGLSRAGIKRRRVRVERIR